MTKTTNVIQKIKILVMLNSLIMLLILFIVFFSKDNTTPNLGQESTSSSITAVTYDNKTNMPSADTALAKLPYVSASGLQQQATAQVVSYQQQPTIKARSSR